MEFVKRRVDFNENVVIEAKGRGIMFNVEEHPENSSYGDWYLVKIRDPGEDWYLVSFYGPPYAAKKRKAWKNLCALLESIQGPWICFGDFNIVLDSEEKDGAQLRAQCPQTFEGHSF